MKELLLRTNVPHTFVEPLMKIHRTVQTNGQQRIQDVAEIISELRDPMKIERSDVIGEKSQIEDESKEEDVEEIEII